MPIPAGQKIFRLRPAFFPTAMLSLAVILGALFLPSLLGTSRGHSSESGRSFMVLPVALPLLPIAVYLWMASRNARLITDDEGLEWVGASGRTLVKARWEEVFTLEIPVRKGGFGGIAVGVGGRLYRLTFAEYMTGAIDELYRRLPHLVSRTMPGF